MSSICFEECSWAIAMAMKYNWPSKWRDPKNAKALDRWWVSAEMDEQTLHDVYLRCGAGKLGVGHTHAGVTRVFLESFRCSLVTKLLFIHSMNGHPRIDRSQSYQKICTQGRLTIPQSWYVPSSISTLGNLNFWTATEPRPKNKKRTVFLCMRLCSK